MSKTGNIVAVLSDCLSHLFYAVPVLFVYFLSRNAVLCVIWFKNCSTDSSIRYLLRIVVYLFIRSFLIYSLFFPNRNLLNTTSVLRTADPYPEKDK